MKSISKSMRHQASRSELRSDLNLEANPALHSRRDTARELSSPLLVHVESLPDQSDFPSTRSSIATKPNGLRSKASQHFGKVRRNTPSAPTKTGSVSKLDGSKKSAPDPGECFRKRHDMRKTSLSAINQQPTFHLVRQWWATGPMILLGKPHELPVCFDKLQSALEKCLKRHMDEDAKRPAQVSLGLSPPLIVW